MNIVKITADEIHLKVEKWRDEKLAEQEATPLSEMPKLTVSMINSKVTQFSKLGSIRVSHKSTNFLGADWGS